MWHVNVTSASRINATTPKNAISGLELKRQLGVSYKTVWLIKHKLLETMSLREERRRLNERVEFDDAYLGGERSGGKAGRGAPGKTPFVAAVQTSVHAALARAGLYQSGP
ncbi:MAG: IS1595 family transposase [Burkholderia sp.]